jgi:CubicO group peptidase (beta-lactamase class C family)
MKNTLLHECTKSQPLLLMIFFILVLIAVPYSLAATQHYPSKTWDKVQTPEALGWSSEGLRLARQYSESIGSAAVMIIVNGEILDEWGETTKKFNVHSMMKNFMNALYGIAVRDGKINLQSTLAELNMDDTEPSLTATEKQARIVDLLQARSGVYHASSADTPAMKEGKPQRGSHLPGTFWYYHNWDFCALGGIYERVMHSSLFEDFNRLIAQPLEMEDFQLADTQYRRGPESIYPWYSFRMSARDLARFGWLYLSRGAWQGTQIVPRQWIEESLKPYSDASSWGRGGYGMLWWVTVHHRLFPNVEVSEQAFAGTGLGGHYLVIIPDMELVVVHRTNTDVPQPRINDKQFGTLLKRILDARMHH